jgi:glycine/D-amino acid oxidase-like deaminating enzyme
MKTAYTEWRDLESAAGKQLLFITGSISMGKSGNLYTTAARQSLDAAGVESEWWDAKQLTKRFPQFRLTDDMDILWQKDTGFLYTSECVLTHLHLAEHHGADVRENASVTRIDWKSEIPIVRTKDSQFLGKRVVVTAGAWTSSLLTELNLPLTVTKQQVCYYKPTDAALFQPDRFPVFTEITTGGEFMYGIPYFGKNGVKVARHGMGNPVSPDTCNRTPDSDYIERMDTYLSKRIPILVKLHNPKFASTPKHQTRILLLTRTQTALIC